MYIHLSVLFGSLRTASLIKAARVTVGLLEANLLWEVLSNGRAASQPALGICI